MSKKTVVITGASRGIGLAIAEKFSESGSRVIVLSRKAPASSKAKIEHIETDMTDAASIRSALKKLPAVDILINNMGAFMPGNLVTETEAELRKCLDANFWSSYWMTQGLLEAFKTKGSGHIFFVNSIAGLGVLENSSLYCVSKATQKMYADCLRKELIPSGVKVTSVCPGPTFTDSWGETKVPRERFMDASDVAELIYTCAQLSRAAVVDNIVLNPLKGNI